MGFLISSYRQKCFETQLNIHNGKKTFLQEFIHQATKQNEAKIAQEKRKIIFSRIWGRKGGLKTKENKKLDKVISIRMTNSEYETLIQNKQKISIKIVHLYSECFCSKKNLKSMNFKLMKSYSQYGTHFKKITNLLRNREWNVFENKKEILVRIENLIELIHQYLYSKTQKNE